MYNELTEREDVNSIYWNQDRKKFFWTHQ